MQLLVRTPAPYPTESLFGYCLRVSERNGYHTPTLVLDYAGLNRQEMRTAAFPVEKFAKVLGRTASELEPVSYCAANDNGERHYKLLEQSLGGSLNDRQLRLSKPAFCLQCVQENGYVDAFWDLSFAVACSVHRCRVLDTCPACGKPLQWLRPGLLTCKCGAFLTDAPLNTVGNPLVELMAVLKAKVHGNKVVTLPNTAGFPLQALDSMSLRSLLGILARLGKFNLLSKELVAGHHELALVEGAAESLANWPTGYHEFLFRLGTAFKRDNPSALGLRHQFLPFYVALFEHNSHAVDANFLRDEFVKFGLTAWGETTVDRKLSEAANIEGEGRFFSEAAIARKVGICRATVRRWAHKGLLSAKWVQAGNQKRFILDAEAAALATQTLGTIIETRKAAGQLGFPVGVLDSLRVSGHFAVRNMPRHKKGFHEADLDNFRRQVLECSAHVANTVQRDEPHISLDSILRNVRFWSTLGKAQFVASYLRREIHSLGRTGDSWKDILFRKADVEAFAKDHLMSASDAPLSHHRAAKLLGCDRKAIPGLIAGGHLVAQSRHNRTLVEFQSLKHFSSQYVPLVAIARQLDTKVARLVRLCRHSSIEMLTFPSRPGSLSPFIARQDEDWLVEAERLHPSRPQRQRERARFTPLAKLQRYLDSLAQTSTPLPRRGGRPDRAKIAKVCGFDRNALYRNVRVAEMLAAFDAEEQEGSRIHS